MTEDDLFEQDFWRTWNPVRMELEDRLGVIKSSVDILFDEVGYPGFEDNIPSLGPYDIDHLGPYGKGLPTTFQADMSAVLQFHKESMYLIDVMGRLAQQQRLLGGSAKLWWVRPFIVSLVLPATLEDRIRYGLDGEDEPVCFCRARVAITKGTVQ